eukprot:2508005-Pyramimonas_sp.AAC.1
MGSNSHPHGQHTVTHLPGVSSFLDDMLGGALRDRRRGGRHGLIGEDLDRAADGTLVPTPQASPWDVTPGNLQHPLLARPPGAAFGGAGTAGATGALGRLSETIRRSLAQEMMPHTLTTDTLDAMLFSGGGGGPGYYSFDEDLSPLLIERGWDPNGAFQFFHTGGNGIDPVMFDGHFGGIGGPGLLHDPVTDSRNSSWTDDGQPAANSAGALLAENLEQFC